MFVFVCVCPVWLCCLGACASVRRSLCTLRRAFLPAAVVRARVARAKDAAAPRGHAIRTAVARRDRQQPLPRHRPGQHRCASVASLMLYLCVVLCCMLCCVCPNLSAGPITAYCIPELALLIQTMLKASAPHTLRTSAESPLLLCLLCICCGGRVLSMCLCVWCLVFVDGVEPCHCIAVRGR